MSAVLATEKTMPMRLSTNAFYDEKFGAVVDFTVSCSSRNFFNAVLYCSCAPSVWRRFNFVLHASWSRSRAFSMNEDAPDFFGIASPVVYPVPEFTMSWRYLLPQISSVLREPVLSTDTASSGAYLFVAFYLNGALVS